MREPARDVCGGALPVPEAVATRVDAQAGADRRVDVQREQPAPLDELGVGAQLVRLHVEEEPPGPKKLLGVDETRRLLVTRTPPRDPVPVVERERRAMTSCDPREL